MPKESDKRKLLKSITHLIQIEVIHEDDEKVEELLQLGFLIKGLRCIEPKISIPKSEHFRSLIWSLPEKEFKQVVRMHGDSFVQIVQKISTHRIFCNNSKILQQDVWIQALVAFEHLGTNGNGASAGCIARGAGISNGSVTLNVNGVITAVLSLKDEFLKWPDAIQRKKIARWFLNEHGIPNVIGVVDGTHIHLSQKPAINGEAYCTQKGCYGINVQFVCNYIKTITYCLVGWPGSVFDQTVFSQSSLSKLTRQFRLHWNPPNINTVLQSKSQITRQQRVQFAFSKARVIVEHTIGILKGCWASLRGFRTQYRKKEDLKVINCHIMATVVLHKILNKFNDKWLVKLEDNTHASNEVMSDTEMLNGDALQCAIKQFILEF